MTIVEYGELGSNSKVTEDRVGHHITDEIITASSTQSFDDSHDLQPPCPSAPVTATTLPFCDDVAQTGGNFCAGLHTSSRARILFVGLMPLDETVTCPRSPYNPHPAGSEIEQALDVEQDVDGSAQALPPTSKAKEVVEKDSQ